MQFNDILFIKVTVLWAQQLLYIYYKVFYDKAIRNKPQIEKIKVNLMCLKEHSQFCYSKIQPERLNESMLEGINSTTTDRKGAKVGRKWGKFMSKTPHKCGNSRES